VGARAGKEGRVNEIHAGAALLAMLGCALRYAQPMRTSPDCRAVGGFLLLLAVAMAIVGLR
jgi:hypothetical protein